jgi:hypothetical protein
MDQSFEVNCFTVARIALQNFVDVLLSQVILLKLYVANGSFQTDDLEYGFILLQNCAIILDGSEEYSFNTVAVTQAYVSTEFLVVKLNSHFEVLDAFLNLACFQVKFSSVDLNLC